MASPDGGRSFLAPSPGGLEAANDNQADLAEARRVARVGVSGLCKLDGRAAVRRLGRARAIELLKASVGAERIRPLISSWPSQTKSGRPERGGVPADVDEHPTMRSFAGRLDRHAAGVVPKPARAWVFALSEVAGSSRDEATHGVRGMLLDVDNPCDDDAARAFVELLDECGIGYVWQTRTTAKPTGDETKHHIHVWFGEPLNVPQPLTEEAKQRAKETMAFVLGVLEELGGLSVIVGGKLGGFDVAKAGRLSGLVYPYAPKHDRQTVPRARAREGGGFSAGGLAEAFGFIPSGRTGPKPVAPAVRQGRRSDAARAGLRPNMGGWDNRDCPFAHEHTTGPGGFGVNVETGAIWCFHASCGGRSREEWREAIAQTYPDLEGHLAFLESDVGTRAVGGDLEHGPRGDQGPSALEWQDAKASELAAMLRGGSPGAVAWQAPTGSGKGYVVRKALCEVTGGATPAVWRPDAPRRVLLVVGTTTAAEDALAKAKADGLDFGLVRKLDASLCCAGGVFKDAQDRGGSRLVRHLPDCEATRAQKAQMTEGRHGTICTPLLAPAAYAALSAADGRPPVVVFDDVLTSEDDGQRAAGETDGQRDAGLAQATLHNWSADFAGRVGAHDDLRVLADAGGRFLQTGEEFDAETRAACDRLHAGGESALLGKPLRAGSAAGEVDRAIGAMRRNRLLLRLAHPRALLERKTAAGSGTRVLYATVPNPIGELAEECAETGPVVVMDATMPAGLGEVFPSLEVDATHIRDNVPTYRAVAVDARASKRGWNVDQHHAPHLVPRWGHILGDIERGIEAAKEGHRALEGHAWGSGLLVAPKTVRLALQAATPGGGAPPEVPTVTLPEEHKARWEGIRQRLPPKLTFGHYGALRSVNAHENVDVGLSVGDPWAPQHATDGRAGLADLEREEVHRQHVRDELAQAHGRGRSRSPGRATPLVLVHVGSVAPADWGSDVVIVRQRPGKAAPQAETWDGTRWRARPLRSPEAPPPAAPAAPPERVTPTVAGLSLKAWRESAGLTTAAAAEVAGVVKATWSRWERGERSPTRERWAEVEDRLGAVLEQPPAHPPPLEVSAPPLAWPPLPEVADDKPAEDGRTRLLRLSLEWGALWRPGGTLGLLAPDMDTESPMFAAYGVQSPLMSRSHTWT